MKNRVIRVGDDLWGRAQQRADEKGETVSEAVRKFLERYGRGEAVTEVDVAAIRARLKAATNWQGIVWPDQNLIAHAASDLTVMLNALDGERDH